MASLILAKKKHSSIPINWVHGDSSEAPNNSFDLAVMTGNVVQVFTTDMDWEENLKNIRNALPVNGLLVFEVRDPSKKAWHSWTLENTYQKEDIPTIGKVEGWCKVLDVTDELVSFRWTYKFGNDEELTSDSTLRFRSKEKIVETLSLGGFDVLDIRDAPDRLGKEFVFIARSNKLTLKESTFVDVKNEAQFQFPQE